MIQVNPLKKSFSKKQDILSGRCLKNLIELLEIDSPTRNIEGVFSVQKWVARELNTLGFSTQFFTHPTNKYAPLLLGYFKGLQNKTVSLVMHADTVLDNQQYGKRGLVFEKGCLFGPGVIDNKGGIIIALEGLRLLLKEERPQYNIQWICVPNEEMGSEGFRETLKSLGQNSDIILGFEPAMNEGDIIHSRHGNRWYEIQISGIEAHSGRCSGEELNAAHEWALKLVKIMDLKSRFNNIKLNVGSVQSSKDKFNVVCGEIHAKLDLRFECNLQRDAVHEEIVNILNEKLIITKQGKTSLTKINIVDDCPAFTKLKNSQLYLECLQYLIKNIEGTQVDVLHSGGASDVNYMSHPSAICIDGLGAIGGKMHTGEEFLKISSLNNRSQVLYSFLKTLNNPQRSVEGSVNGFTYS